MPETTGGQLRIAHLGKYYAPVHGGIERVTQSLAEWQAARGHHVDVLVHQRPGLRSSVTQRLNGVTVRRVGCLGAPLYTPVSPAWPRQLARLLDEAKPDVLHVQMPNPWCFFLLASRAARRIPWVLHWQADVTAAVPDWRVRAAYRAYQPLERSLLAHADVVVATSSAYADASEPLMPWRSRVHVIPIGIAPLPRIPADAVVAEARDSWPPGDRLRLLALGRLSYYKGFGILLDALARGSDATLLVVGDGEQRDALAQQAMRLGLSTRVRFSGQVDDVRLAALQVAADALVLPSLDRSESFGVVQLEAMRAATAVIASDVPGSGVSSVAQHGVTGLHVPPGDAVALADAIGRLEGDRDLCQRMGAAGQVRWQERFSLDASAQSFLDLYRQLRSGRIPARAS